MLKACILGATGAAGQNIVESLKNHPWFQIHTLAASKKSAGLSYCEAINEAVFFNDMPEEEIFEMKVSDVSGINPSDFDMAFSALPSSIAKDLEQKFALKVPVISTASAYRYDADVPILMPDVNPGHIEMIDYQKRNRGWEGFICPGPNCTTVGLVTTLKPLQESFGVRAVHMVSMQALSGSGEKGLRRDSEYRRSAEMNVLPYIEGEEEKVIKETRKIMGKLDCGVVRDADIELSCSCNRVYVENVHTEVVFAMMDEECTVEEVKKTFSSFTGETQRLGLPSAPDKIIAVMADEYMPQPRAHIDHGGMVTLVGRVRKDTVFKNGIVYLLTSDNLDKGAGGGAVQTAEFLKVKGYI